MMKSTTADKTMKVLKNIFDKWIASDNGPQCVSEVFAD